MRFILIILMFGSVQLVYSQQYSPKGGKYKGNKSKFRGKSNVLKRNSTDIFPLEPEFALNGWSAALGGTYMIPMSGESDRSVYNPGDTASSIVQYEGKPRGRMGFYAEVSYFHAFHNPRFFHFYDVGISYRQYRGGENFSGTQDFGTDSMGQQNVTTINQSSEYSDQAVSLIANLTHHRHFSRYGFLQNSIGLNGDYFFSTSRTAPVNFPLYEPDFHPDLQFQLNYRIGVGWKVTPTVLVIPSVQFPILTAYPFENGKSSLQFYATRQYPIIFSIRVMLLRRLKEFCNVPNYDGPADFQ